MSDYDKMPTKKNSHTNFAFTALFNMFFVDAEAEQAGQEAATAFNVCLGNCS